MIIWTNRGMEAARAAWRRLACAVRLRASRAQEAVDAALERRWVMAMARSPRWSAVGSVALHGIIILACMINGHLHFHVKDGAIPPIVPVELVTTADETDIASMAREQLLLPENDKNVAPAAPTAPPETAPSFEMKLFPTPPSPNQNKSGGQGENLTPAAAPSSAPRKAAIGDFDIAAIGDAKAMTMSLIDSLRNQIAQCWHPPATSAGGSIAITFELFLSRDGSLSRPPEVAGPVDSNQQHLRAAVEAARRAIYTCAPYVLPPNRYAQWQNLTLTLDPKMLATRPDRLAD